MERPPVDAPLGARAKRKLEKAQAVIDGKWTRCMFRMARKARFCNVARVEGSMYCGNHISADESVESRKSQKYKAETRKRVPCPLDPSHTVYLFDLKKHVEICNKLKDDDALRQLPYYSFNINSGDHATMVDTDIADEAHEPTEDESVISQQHVSGGEMKQSVFQILSKMDYQGLARRIDAAYMTQVGTIATRTLNHRACADLMSQKQAKGAQRSALRHIQQQASILGHMEEKKLLDSSHMYIELGAGRAMLSLALTQIFPASHFILVDRAGSRGKADSYIGVENACVRAKIDIRHLNLSGMDNIMKTPSSSCVVAMSKHLCGLATDLSLRALTTTLPMPKLKGIAIALCCHHACHWPDYVNPAFFLNLGFSSAEFKLFISLSGWATCGYATDGDAVETVLGWSRERRTIIGRQCKRLIDMGRVLYLRQLGMCAELVHYCEENESLENCLLLAWWPPPTDIVNESSS